LGGLVAAWQRTVAAWLPLRRATSSLAFDAHDSDLIAHTHASDPPTLEACGPSLQLSPMPLALNPKTLNPTLQACGPSMQLSPMPDARSSGAGPAEDLPTGEDPPRIRVVVRKRPMNKKVRALTLSHSHTFEGARSHTPTLSNCVSVER
jgi:hypothetical protein